MKRSSAITKAMPLVISVGLLVSACASEPDYGAPAYAYSDPYYGSAYFDFGWGHFHHFDHFPGDRFHVTHGGFHHGFAGHHGFGGHGGHGGGGHR